MGLRVTLQQRVGAPGVGREVSLLASLGPQPGPVSLSAPLRPQYMMLSGQVPFQGASGQGGQSQAAEIMCKIREGRFSLDGEAWQSVSEEAKELVRGAEREATGSCWVGIIPGPGSWCGC